MTSLSTDMKHVPLAERERLPLFQQSLLPNWNKRPTWSPKPHKSLRSHPYQHLSITRARRASHDRRTSCNLVIDNRSRMEPPLPQEYFGNSVHAVSGEATARELLENDLGWAAWKLPLAVQTITTEWCNTCSKSGYSVLSSFKLVSSLTRTLCWWVVSLV